MNRSPLAGIAAVLAVLFASTANAWLDPADTKAKSPAKPGNDKKQAVQSLPVAPPEFKTDTWADNSVVSFLATIAFEPSGNLLVGEHPRMRHGTEDNREHVYWTKDDYAAKTVEDRLAMYQKWAAAGKKPMSYYSEAKDRIRRVRDTNGDGKADHAVTLAEFNDPLDGALTGVHSRPDGIWVANIPTLWRLADRKGDGVYAKEVVQTGFGVKVSYHGHDMHGVMTGPDGRIYWSIGDRGYHVVDQNGKVWARPDTGAIFRCEPDGSRFEVVATGLRNPQEMVFDELGNMFTVDNDADGEDKPRLIHIVLGGEYGWRMGFQYPDEDRPHFAPFRERPWWDEGYWKPGTTAAFLLPPAGTLIEGPCGVAVEPGVSNFPDSYRLKFFVSDYRGNQGGVHSFGAEPKGSTFVLTDPKPFLTSCAPTDLDFGPDGSLYVGEWLGGLKDGIGRITRVRGANVAAEKETTIAAAAKILADGMKQRDDADLCQLLGHSHAKIRLEAQIEITSRGAKAIASLDRMARSSDVLLARLHAIAAYGALVRQGVATMNPWLDLAGDRDPQVRIWTVRQLIDSPIPEAKETLLTCLKDADPRVRLETSLAAGRSGDVAFVQPLLDVVRRTGGQDPYVRHAAVMGLVDLSRAGHSDAVFANRRADDVEVRLAILLVARRLQNPLVAEFLVDADPRVVREAASAINDGAIEAALPSLAQLTTRSPTFADLPIAFRALNANFRLGGTAELERVTAVALAGEIPAIVRQEAMALLAEWPTPSPRDHIVGAWRPLAERSKEPVLKVVGPAMTKLLRDADPNLRRTAIALAVHLKLDQVANDLAAIAGNENEAPAARGEAIRGLAAGKDVRFRELADQSIRNPAAEIRAAGRELLVAIDVNAGVKELQVSVERGDISERRAALHALAMVPDQRAFQTLLTQYDRLIAGKIPAELHLDVMTAHDRSGDIANVPLSIIFQRRRKITESHDKYAKSMDASAGPLVRYAFAIYGGDAARGEKVFFHMPASQCTKCHRVGSKGASAVGPDLGDVARRLTREQILESILEPAKQIAKGFESVTVVLDDGDVITGMVAEETPTHLVLKKLNPDSTLAETPTRIEISRIEQRSPPSSAMPKDLHQQISRDDLRDLVEYLSHCRAPAAPSSVARASGDQ